MKKLYFEGAGMFGCCDTAWAENWRATKAEYFDAAMARRGITCSGAEG